MKTAVSIPDPLFQAGERSARRMKMSRSGLYAAALAEYLKRRDAKQITAELDAVYAAQSSRLDEGLHLAQLQSLPKPW